jgi:hypothetical protein
MGPQSSGKSTIAKIISYCQWVEKRFILDGEYRYDFSEQFIEFHRLSKVYFSKNSLIDYRSDAVHISYKGSSNTQTIEKLNDESNTVFYNSKNIYIPAERNFVSAIPNLGKYKRVNNDNIMNFLYDWYEVKKRYSKSNKYPILNLGVSYYHMQENDEDILVLKENNKELLLNNASSGLQSILPLLLLFDFLTKELFNEKAIGSVDEKEEIEKLVKFYVNDFMKKMDNEQKQYEFLKNIEIKKSPFDTLELEQLVKNIEARISYYYSSIIIEEPEQNLFPNTQKDLVYFMLKLINDKKRDHKLLITTHSPYVLYAINNCIMGYLVKEKMPKNERKILESTKASINPEQISIWEIEENKGTIKCIQGKDGLIEDNYFDGSMKILMDDFYSTLNYYEDEE